MRQRRPPRRSRRASGRGLRRLGLVMALAVPVAGPSGAADAPPYALPLAGGGWQCMQGYHRVGDRCARTELPEGALPYGTGGWRCAVGEVRIGDRCERIVPPPNARPQVGGGWDCAPGYTLRGERCVPLAVPPNASPTYGGGWLCDPGFVRAGNHCQRRVPPVEPTRPCARSDAPCGESGAQAVDPRP